MECVACHVCGGFGHSVLHSAILYFGDGTRGARAREVDMENRDMAQVPRKSV